VRHPETYRRRSAWAKAAPARGSATIPPHRSSWRAGNPRRLPGAASFTPQRAYGTAKPANILFTREPHRRHHGQGISAAALHPGTVASNFASGSGNFVHRMYGNRIARLLMTTPQKAAGQLSRLAEGRPGTDWLSGTDHEKRKPARRLHPQARAENLCRQLWDRSEHLLSLTQEKERYRESTASATATKWRRVLAL
jgi:NAD(P)-dependent dehydrogenase (short-subunit alcohol dehydrogenase family)